MSTVEDFKQPNPIKENRQGLIGKPVDRYDGPLKVSGKAPYAYEVQPPSPPAYGVMVRPGSPRDGSSPSTPRRPKPRPA